MLKHPAYRRFDAWYPLIASSGPLTIREVRRYFTLLFTPSSPPALFRRPFYFFSLVRKRQGVFRAKRAQVLRAPNPLPASRSSSPTLHLQLHLRLFHPHPHHAAGLPSNTTISTRGTLFSGLTSSVKYRQLLPWTCWTCPPLERFRSRSQPSSSPSIGLPPPSPRAFNPWKVRIVTTSA